MSPRKVRMVALMELEVRPTWTGEHIEQAVRVMMEALSFTAEEQKPANIRVTKYAVHTIHNAYARLLDST